MAGTDALAQARRLPADGFVVSAANVLVNDARAAARESLEPPLVEAHHAALVNALDLAVARLRQHREAIQDAPPFEEPAPKPAPAKKGRQKRK